MIRYNLCCPAAHEFDSWFQSAAAFDALKNSGQLECPTCGDRKIEKLLMAPAVRPARKASEDPPVPAAKPLATPQTELEKAMTDLRDKIEANSEYVGENFAREARRMHEGESPERAIYGEAKLEEAKKLLEEGIPVAPLPFLPRRKAN